MRLRATQMPPESVPGEFSAQALSSFTDAARLLPKLTRSHRKLFSLLGIDPRVGLWAAAMLVQPSPFQQGELAVIEVLVDVATVYTQTMCLLLSPGPYIPPEKQTELWQQHLQLPQWQLQLERQLALLVPFVLLHSASRLFTASVANLDWMMTATKVVSQAQTWWEDYMRALPLVVEDPWLQPRLPVQWVDDALPALLRLGHKAADSLTAAAAAARGGSAPGSAAAAGAAASSSGGNTHSERSKWLMSALEGTVPSVGQILRQCTESATNWMYETGQLLLDREGYGQHVSPAAAPHCAMPELLQASLASAADAFAVVEAFVGAAAAGFDGGSAQNALIVGVFQFMLGACKGTVPVASLCWHEDDGKSARSLYSLLMSCLKLQSTQSALPARVAAAEVHATLLVCRAAILMLQDRHWQAALLQAGATPAAQQDTAAAGFSPSYDPVIRLPSVVLFGRCCLLWAQEIKTGLPGLLT